MSRGKICFVGLDNYPVLNPEYSGVAAGEPIQQVLLAKAFARLGYTVSTVVHDCGQPDGETIDGVTVHKAFRKGSGLPIIRFLTPNLTKLIRALEIADADYYYQSCAGAVTGIVAWYCARRGRRFLFRTASDTDCIPGGQLIRFWRDRKIYEYGIRRANLIAVQSNYQRKLLADNYGLNSDLVNMAVEIPSPGRILPNKDLDVLWVSNFRPLKRAEIALEVARRLPDVRFCLVGGPPANGREEYYCEMERLAAAEPNVHFAGPVPYAQVDSYFDRAKIFLSTSLTEGFPNTYLQAWARAVPTVGFFDPDGVVATHGLGAVPKELEGMANEIARLLTNNDDRAVLGARAKAYVTEAHVPDMVARSYECLVRERM